MKLIFSISLVTKILASECELEGCLSNFCIAFANDDDECETNGMDGFRTMVKAGSMVKYLMCPDDENSANPACAGRTTSNGKFISFKTDIKRAIKNYGCNCFQENFREISESGSSALLPKSNGRPIDDFDSACYQLNQKYRCFVLDKLNGELEDTCDYQTAYNWHVNENGEIKCGRKNDVNYAESNDICRNALCQMELQFAKRMAAIINDPRQFKLDNNKNYDLWENEKCFKGESVMKKDMCCGKPGPYEINQRVPFDPMEQCCQDGNIVSQMECILD